MPPLHILSPTGLNQAKQPKQACHPHKGFSRNYLLIELPRGKLKINREIVSDEKKELLPS